MADTDAALRFIQLSDPHLFADAGGELRGVATLESFERVLATARDRHLPPDAILLTGDIAQDESRGAYRRAIQTLTGTGVRVLCIPGNHDDPVIMREEFSSPQFSVCGAHLFGNWLIVMASSFLADSAAGRITESDLSELHDQLSDYTNCHTLVAIHHHPISTGSRWLDTVGLENADEFFHVLGRHKQVRATDGKLR